MKSKKDAGRWIVFFASFLCLMIINCISYVNHARIKTSMTVVIDAGHGGNDPGKVGVDGIQEKDLNLQIAKRLKAELQVRGVQVVMTRELDESLAISGARNKKMADLQTRIDIVEGAHADYMVSIHQNSYPDTGVTGPQVFYNSRREESKRLANIIQDKLVRDLKPKKERNVKEGNDYYILKKSSCPSAIIECGFISSPEESEMLQNDKYQQKLAQSIAEALCSMQD